MKKWFYAFILMIHSVAFAELRLDVVDQNFSSTQKIVIEQDEIKKSGVSDVPSLLLAQANISVTSTSIQPNSIFIRGGDSSHVLILIDGVPVYDASTPQKTTNLFSLPVSKIRRLTILKGSQSVIYGGQALSGVISIETFSDQDRPQTTLMLEVAMARAQALQQTFSVDGLYPLTDSMQLSLSVNGLKAKNNSPVQNSDQLYLRNLGGVEVGLKTQGEFENIIKLGYSKDENEISDSDFTTSQAVDVEDYQSNISSSNALWVFKKENVFTLSSSVQKTDRTLQQPLDKSFSGFETDLQFEGSLSNIRLEVPIYINSFVNLLTGMQLASESMQFKNNDVIALKASDQSEGVFLKSTFLLPSKWRFEYGIRHETSKLKSLATVQHIGLDWNKVFMLEYSTGLKTPSLFQKYDVTFGDPDLKPERSKSFSASLDHQFNDQVSTSLTYFDSQFENLIDYSFAASKYQNIFATRTTGVESITKISFLRNSLRAYLGLGYQEPRDVTAGQWLARRALHSGSFKLSGNISESTELGSEFIYIGEKADRAGAAPIKVDEYTLWNLFGSWSWASQHSVQNSIFTRVENVTAQEYQTVYGYYSKGATYKLGVQLAF